MTKEFEVILRNCRLIQDKAIEARLQSSVEVKYYPDATIYIYLFEVDADLTKINYYVSVYSFFSYEKNVMNIKELCECHNVDISDLDWNV